MRRRDPMTSFFSNSQITVKNEGTTQRENNLNPNKLKKKRKEAKKVGLQSILALIARIGAWF